MPFPISTALFIDAFILLSMHARIAAGVLAAVATANEGVRMFFSARALARAPQPPRDTQRERTIHPWD